MAAEPNWQWGAEHKESIPPRPARVPDLLFTLDVHHFAEQNDPEGVLRSVRDGGCGVDALDEFDCTPLHIASALGNMQAAGALLECGATVDARDKLLCTPLHAACEGGGLQVVQMLLDAGAYIDVYNGDRQTPLHYAAGYAPVEVVAALVFAGASMEARDSRGRTPLHTACLAGNEAATQLLLERGASVEAQNTGGRSALHFACMGGHEGLVALLLEAGADATQKDNKGFMACNAIGTDVPQHTKAAIMELFEEHIMGDRLPPPSALAALGGVPGGAAGKWDRVGPLSGMQDEEASPTSSSARNSGAQEQLATQRRESEQIKDRLHKLKLEMDALKGRPAAKGPNTADLSPHLSPSVESPDATAVGTRTPPAPTLTVSVSSSLKGSSAPTTDSPPPAAPARMGDIAFLPNVSTPEDGRPGGAGSPSALSPPPQLQSLETYMASKSPPHAPPRSASLSELLNAKLDQLQQLVRVTATPKEGSAAE